MGGTGGNENAINHMAEGVKLSLKEHIEKTSPLLQRVAQYEKSTAMKTLPQYLWVQFARFGYKQANDWAGTAANRVKHLRKMAFSANMDVFEFCGEELQKELKIGRLKLWEKKEIEDEKKRQEIANTGAKETKEDTDKKDSMDVDAEQKPA